MRSFYRLAILVLLLAAFVSSAAADEFLEGLQPGQVVQGFRTLNLYDNASGQAMGARFMSEKYGYIIDLLQIQSVPQAFYWVKTPITSSRGEPHACEHLLLGKGNRGRFVAALEDMALGNSTAYTGQYRTCYHFNTTAGDDTFYRIYEAKLAALLHPDFTDEEIRREVCYVGVVTDPEDSSLSIDEKGTAYTEMVSSFERPYYHTYRSLYKLVYGEAHPFTFTAGGDPDVMRDMVPQHMRDFHEATHHLSNMGSIVSIPTSIPVESFLHQMSMTLDRCQDFADSSALPGIGVFSFPSPDPAPPGTSRLVHYPSDRTEDPGYLLYSWPADLELDVNERAVLDLFLEAFGSGETSDLYNLFINSETRQIDLGANAVDGWIEDDFGNPISFDLTGVNSSLVDQRMLDSVATMLVNAVRRIYAMADGSEELLEFNTRAKNRLIEYRKQIENNLNRPPMFGFRGGPAGRWLGIMDDLEDIEGFRKSLVFEEQFDYLDSLLALDHNIWKERIDSWRLLTIPPYAVGATPSPDIVPANNAAKEARLAGYIEEFKEQYGTDDVQLAIAGYKEEFDARTAELEAVARDDELPGFIDNPPMTLDDQLDYQTISLDGDVPLVASTFDNMSSSRVGLALKLDVIPESLMTYVPFLPSVLTSIGVIKDGEVITFDDMQERLRQEVLNFNAYFSTGLQRGRVELVLASDGSNLEELHRALDWMDASLYSPYLSADNLPRIRDRIDQLIQGNRNRIRGSEESWVGSPAAGYRYQENPLIMSAICFLTATHHLQRLRWLLTDPGEAADQAELNAFLGALKDFANDRGRQELSDALASLEAVANDPEAEVQSDLASMYRQLGETARAIAKDLVVSLKLTLGDIPDATLEGDWEYLLTAASEDLMVQPDRALSQLRNILGQVSRLDNARAFMISNTVDREASLERIGQLVGKLGTDKSVRQVYDARQRVVARLADRHPGLESPVYVGLVHAGTQNGVMIYNARIADQYDTTANSVLNCLSGKLYGGNGPHGLFMKTLAAGLAYSNGYAYGQGAGRVQYYAERCPDIAETMRFVVGELQSAEPNPNLVDYAVAQVFGFSRAPSRYEQRGEAMAANLTDGTTPDVVRRFREKVLEARDQDNLFDDIVSRMETAYGPVLIG
ncbi:MAG: hypothetical protein JSU65_01500, partial [Candidatus Zixiibacteriota bacterium]